MFVYSLPYSKEKFSIKPFLFKDQLDVSRLIYESNNEGLSRYLVDFFEIDKLNIIDKLFVLMKSRQLFVNDSLTLNVNDKSVNINLSVLLDPLFTIKNSNKILAYKNLFVEFDYPSIFTSDSQEDALSVVIKSMKIDSEIINFEALTIKDRETIISNLPADFIKIIRDYFNETSSSVTLYNGKKGLIDKIEVDFFTTEPFYIVKNLYSGYPLNYCRDVIRYLSSKMDSSIIMSSTPSDIKYYLEEYNKSDAGQSEESL